jgi:hypothetical protein
MHLTERINTDVAAAKTEQFRAGGFLTSIIGACFGHAAESFTELATYAA